MRIPLQITFRGIDASDALKADIEARARELETYCGDITSCRIMVETPHRRHRTGALYHVRIDITVPGEELIVDRSPDQHVEHKDVHVALRDAFQAARRELQDYVRLRRREVKTHVGPPHGVVTQVFHDQGYGFLQGPDGRDIYFHANSVIGDFAELEPGAEVRYAEEMGERGPQASTVTPVGKNGHRPERIA